jgi:hypothetical protein
VKKHDWHNILGKNMIGNTLLEKKHDWQHILGKTKIVNRIWGEKKT